MMAQQVAQLNRLPIDCRVLHVDAGVSRQEFRQACLQMVFGPLRLCVASGFQPFGCTISKSVSVECFKCRHCRNVLT